MPAEPGRSPPARPPRSCRPGTPLRRAIHAAKYLSDPAYRRKIARQLNKGESLHALRRDLHYAQQGTIGKPLLADHTEQAWCLTVLTNSVITWVTEYYQLAVQELRATGRDVPDELLAHISPAHSDNINFFGVITVDVEAELAKLDQAGWRPLRPAAPAPEHAAIAARASSAFQPITRPPLTRLNLECMGSPGALISRL
jgi:Tn3 transposase DDE domain